MYFSEYVVAESVVVIKKLLQTQENEHNDILKQMAKLLDFITVPAARAAILWLIGEYNNRVPKIAPDVLRKAAKSFADEQNIVKLQILNLAVKLYAYNHTQIQLLCQYIFNLARYDQNYDIRCRARLLKQFIFPSKEDSLLSHKMKDIFLAIKPAPALESKYKGREHFQLGSMSHYLSQRVNGYQDLPKFPEVAPDNSVRNVEVPPQETRQVENKTQEKSKSSKGKGAVPKHKSRSFYSESEEKSSSEDEDSDSEDSGSSESGSESDSESESSESQERNTVGNGKESSESSESNSDSEEEEDSSDEDDTSDESSESPVKNPRVKNGAKSTNNGPQPPSKSNLDLLLDLEDFAPVAAPLMTPSLGGFLSPMTLAPNSVDGIELIGPSYIPNSYNELLNKINGFGLAVTYRYTRGPHLFSAYMVSIELLFTNHGSLTLRDIHLGKTTLPSGVILNEFAPIEVLDPKSSVTRILGIDFNDSTQSLAFEIVSDAGTSKVNISATVGAFLRAVSMSEKNFIAERQKLRGMTEHTTKLQMSLDAQSLRQKIFEIANVGGIPSNDPNLLLFAGHTMNSRSLVLITVHLDQPTEAESDTKDVEITVNCEKMVIGSILLNEIKAAIKN